MSRSLTTAGLPPTSSRAVADVSWPSAVCSSTVSVPEAMAPGMPFSGMSGQDVSSTEKPDRLPGSRSRSPSRS